MSMYKAMRQMPERSGRASVVRGEAAHDPASDEAKCPRHETTATGLGLPGAASTGENLQRALERVRANNGAAGVDGLDIGQTALHLKTHWPPNFLVDGSGSADSLMIAAFWCAIFRPPIPPATLRPAAPAHPARQRLAAFADRGVGRFTCSTGSWAASMRQDDTGACGR